MSDEWLAEGEAVRRRDPAMFADTVAILFRLDPMGIGSEDETEYEREAGMILLRLERAGSRDDVERIVREEFILFGEPDLFKAAADEIWQLWVRRQSQSDQQT